MNFYDFYRMVQANQTLLVEFTKKGQQNTLTEENQSHRFVLTIRTTSDGVALLNDYGTMEYSIADQKTNHSENVEKQSIEELDENSVNATSETFDETNQANPKIEYDGNTDSDSTHKILFSRKNIDEKLPEHLKVRTSKEKSDAQIKEFVNLNCNICKSSPQFNSFKELQDHFSGEHNQRGYVECCDKKFYRKDRLMNHITNHIYPDAFK